MLDIMQKTVERNLLKYSAGRAIACKCGKIADWRSWVIVERPDGSIAGNCCAHCYDTASDGHNLPEGYKVIRYAAPKKTARKPTEFPQKPGKALNAYLRRTIHAAHKAAGNCTKHDRLFPAAIMGDVVMRETVLSDGTVNYWYPDNPSVSDQTRNFYIAEFCRLNHLTGS